MFWGAPIVGWLKLNGGHGVETLMEGMGDFSFYLMGFGVGLNLSFI